MEITCRLHSTESFGTLDGPGIRFVVFLQGCPLKCKYCHNRDTWDEFGGEVVSIEKILELIHHSITYIKASNGGVTVSGGEPLLQAKFVKELFKILHNEGIHTCLDTAGSLQINNDIKEMLEFTDLVLLDVKHINSIKSVDLTGQSNANNLAFAKYLNDNKIPMWIRQVLVPGYTDNKEDLLQLKDFIYSLDNVEKVEILPYHDYGKYKWENLGVEYPLENVKLPTQKDIDKAKEILGILD